MSTTILTPAPATTESLPIEADHLYRCQGSTGFEARKGGGFRSQGCRCVFHLCELREANGELLAPCGHSYANHGGVPLTPEQAREAARPQDVQRWEQAIAERLIRMSLEAVRANFADITADLMLGNITARGPAGGAFRALWITRGPEIATATVLALVRAVLGGDPDADTAEERCQCGDPVPAGEAAVCRDALGEVLCKRHRPKGGFHHGAGSAR